MQSTVQNSAAIKLSRDFWWFWTGQVISNLGSSITLFALPLIVFRMTGSSVDLAIGFASGFVPYLLFGLLIGALTDRWNRKLMMVLVDIGRGVVISLIPIAWAFGLQAVWVIYIIAFVHTILKIFFDSAQFAAIPALVNKDKIVQANSYIQSSFAAGSILGPIIAGALIALLPLQSFLFADSASFFISAITLFMIRGNFNTDNRRSVTGIFKDIGEGLRYVFKHPVLRNISIMMALVNFFGSTRDAQIVRLAQSQLHADSTQTAWLFAAGSLGIILLSLTADFWRKRFPFHVVALSALMCCGILTFVLSFVTVYWIALPLWGVITGSLIFFNMMTGSLRQAIVPNNFLGRVVSVAMVTAWSTIPVGALIGGTIIDKTGQISFIYGLIGVVFVVIPGVFFFTSLGKADRFIEMRKAEEAAEAELKRKDEAAKAAAEREETAAASSDLPVALAAEAVEGD